MRTTLKRGIGRGAGLNGNGGPVYPPAIAPVEPPQPPVTVYRSQLPPRRTRTQILGRLVVGLLVAIVVVAAGFAGGAYLYAEESAQELRPTEGAVVVAQQELGVAPPDQPAIALVMGIDPRKGVEAGLEARSDTLMLIRADPQRDTLSMLSFPRDLWVEIHCPGQPTTQGRINSVFADCKHSGVVRTVSELVELPINYLITVNFSGFKRVVNTVGGVWVDVDRRYFNDQTGPGGYAKINLQPGYQLLTGGAALDYVRYRHADSDLYRHARQQQFVKALKQQLTSSFEPRRFFRIVGILKENVQIGVGGGRALDADTILSYAGFARDLPSGRFFQTKLTGLTENATYDVQVPEENLREAIAEFTNPDIDATRVANAAALGRKLKTNAPRAKDTTVVVLNGNGVPGSAGNASYQLGQRGYDMRVPPDNQEANAPTTNYFHSKVYFAAGDAAGEVAAKKVATLFGAADVEQRPSEFDALCGDVMLCVVVGQTFHGELAPAPVEKVVERKPPAVVPNNLGTADHVRNAQKMVRFPLMTPTVVERTSSTHEAKPVRAYGITRGHKAVRLSFSTGASKYWGIQMTTWNDAPVLRDKSFRHKLKDGRTYDFYYSGPKLHMVVLRHGNASYWVVNSLDNELSNETMIAIAKGLKPLTGS
jgi:LCP family protein required for cell wall assembly